MTLPLIQEELEYISKYKLRNDLLLYVPNCEDIWTEISTNQGSIIFAVISRHPYTNFLDFVNALCNTLTELGNQKLKYIVSGDINYFEI